MQKRAIDVYTYGYKESVYKFIKVEIVHLVLNPNENSVECNT